MLAFIRMFAPKLAASAIEQALAGHAPGGRRNLPQI
jgi:hypothetical protein